MENEQMKAVFSELLDNQKEIARSQKELMDAFQELNNQIKEKTCGMQTQNTDIMPVDIKPIQQAVERGINDIRIFLLTQQQKPETNNWRVFMESDAKKWAVILVVTLAFLTYLYCYLVHKS